MSEFFKISSGDLHIVLGSFGVFMIYPQDDHFQKRLYLVPLIRDGTTWAQELSSRSPSEHTWCRKGWWESGPLSAGLSWLCLAA